MKPKAAIVVGLLALILAISVGVAACSLSDDPEADTARAGTVVIYQA